jgi:membrane fusion protein (multidrug efflux system)
VRALFPNPKSVLLPGMFVRAQVEEGVTENAFLVPQVGVTHDQKGQATALVVGADNKVQARTLQLGGTQGDQWIVEGGLDEGDRVIVAGVQRVQPGAVVVATEAPSGTAAPGASAAAAPNAPAKNVVADAKPAPQRPVAAQTK